MQDCLFEEWLRNIDERPQAQVSDNMSRIRRLEKAGWNLDKEYDNDHGASLLKSLVVQNPALAHCNLPIDKIFHVWHLVDSGRYVLTLSI